MIDLEQNWGEFWSGMGDQFAAYLSTLSDLDAPLGSEIDEKEKITLLEQKILDMQKCQEEIVKQLKTAAEFLENKIAESARDREKENNYAGMLLFLQERKKEYENSFTSHVPILDQAAKTIGKHEAAKIRQEKELKASTSLASKLKARAPKPA